MSYPEDSAVSDVESSPGEGNEKSGYRFHGQYVMVTYNQCLQEDATQFESDMKRSLTGRLKPGVTMRYFGCQERHEKTNGGAHYHVVFVFSQAVKANNARGFFSVVMDVDGTETWASQSIHISGLERGQSAPKFLTRTQDYVSKCEDAVLFGARIGLEGVGRGSGAVARLYQQVLQTPYREDADELLRMRPEAYVTKYGQLQAFLATKKRKPVREEQQDVEGLEPWVLPEQLVRWKEKYFAPDWKGRPKVLLLRGPSRAGKTAWAESLGNNPMVLGGRFSYDEIIPNATHVVLNDIQWDKFDYWREFLGCQKDFVITGKYRVEKRVRLGVPVVVTCNKDNDPRLLPNIKAYLEDTGAVVVTLEGPLFEDSRKRRKVET